MPVTRCEAPSQIGRAPISASACAMSSPPVRMLAGAPGGERDRARPFALLLDVALDQQRRRIPAEMPGRRRRHGAAVDRVEVAPGRQHVGAPAGRRAGRPGRDEPAVERRAARRRSRRRRSASTAGRDLHRRSRRAPPASPASRIGAPARRRPASRASSSSRSTVSPWLRQAGRPERAEPAASGRARARPSRSRADRSLELEIERERAQQRGIAGRPAAARHARSARPAGRSAARPRATCRERAGRRGSAFP